MYPYVHIKFLFIDKDYSSYGIAVLFAFLFFLIPALVDNQKRKEDFFNRFLYLVFLLLIGTTCAAVLFQITNIPIWKIAIPLIKANPSDWKNYINIGIVYYGGFIGIIIGAMVYSKFYNEDIRRWIPTTVLSIPGFHAVGRVGCAIAGCCYGFEVTSGGIYNARIDKYCFPVQLIEAAGELTIFFIILLILLFKLDKKNLYLPLSAYCIIYGILRFILEFYRGDKLRGLWGPFSTSQYISMVVVPFGVYCLVCPQNRNFLDKWYSGRKKKTNTVTKD